jgi:hypothetical protein
LIVEHPAKVEGDIEGVGGVLKITRIRVNYHVKVLPGKEGEVQFTGG